MVQAHKECNDVYLYLKSMNSEGKVRQVHRDRYMCDRIGGHVC